MNLPFAFLKQEHHVWQKEKIGRFGEIVATSETKKELDDSNKIRLTLELSDCNFVLIVLFVCVLKLSGDKIWSSRLIIDAMGKTVLEEISDQTTSEAYKHRPDGA
ncbi:hypothetical protein P8452_15649 [Trifolium repens]|nr:hypothetical protein P8452_15649 [Trifolium repens]